MSEKEDLIEKDNMDTVREMIVAIGENPDREGLKDTPKRVVKMWKELFRGYNEHLKPKITTFNNGNDGLIVDQMIMDCGSFNSMCEHHMMVFTGKYFFAYVPSQDGKILGLSKVARIVDYYSARLQIQERLVNDIVKAIWDELSIDGVEPLGMGLVMEANHTCKSIRGVKKEGIMRTTKLMGTFLSEPEVRAEFLNWVNK